MRRPLILSCVLLLAACTVHMPQVESRRVAVELLHTNAAAPAEGDEATGAFQIAFNVTSVNGDFPVSMTWREGDNFVVEDSSGNQYLAAFITSKVEPLSSLQLDNGWDYIAPAGRGRRFVLSVWIKGPRDSGEYRVRLLRVGDGAIDYQPSLAVFVTKPVFVVHQDLSD